MCTPRSVYMNVPDGLQAVNMIVVDGSFDGEPFGSEHFVLSSVSKDSGPNCF